jgi:hypothetical protein
MKIRYKKEVFIENLPSGFINPASSERFLQSCFGGEKNTIIGVAPRLGVRCDFGFMQGEYFTSDEEPARSSEQGFGFQMWQRIQSKQRGTGWIQLPQFFCKSTTALVDLEAYQEEYWRDWSQHARRYRKKWLSQKELVVSKVAKEMFLDAYKKSTLKASLRELFTKSIHRHSAIYGTDVSFLVVENRVTGEVLAGTMIVDDLVANRTFHPVAFIVPAAKKTQASLGLIEYWMQETKKKGIRFLDLGIVWMPGDPPSWKGYSQFKMHFHPRLIRYQAPLIRFFWHF